jgi:outer membrane immunogenic protein
MKKLLLAGVALSGLVAAGAASAADLPRRTAPVAPIPAPAIPIFTWSGFYVGLQAGYAWGNNNRDFGTVTTVDLDGDGLADVAAVDNGFFGNDDDNDGFVGGAHAGYNFQFGSIVLGAEADIEATGIGGGREFAFVDRFGNTYTVNSGNDIDWQGSVRGRVGFAFDRALIYATGGLAFADFAGNGETFTGPFGTFFGSRDDGVEWGWTLGAGVEYAFTNNLTTRVEYRYTNFERGGNRFNEVAFSSGGDDVDFHTVRAGVSYKF